ncbi:MAG TPA: ABC transporter permease, partial [Bryobacteraceae bacterium]|nr:ABC transporter permease [Bryobacteraceae bacterium]
MKAQLHHLISRVRALFQTRADDREFDDELATHLEMLEAEKRRNGMSADEARRAARLEIGAVTQLREAHREVRTVPLVDTLSKDLQYTFRTLRRESSFAVFSVLILGLGIAACSTVFTAVNTLLLRDLPFHEPDRLIWMATQADDGIAEWRLQVNHVLDLRRQSTSFADLAGYYGYFGKGDRVLTGSGEPERVTIVPVTENFFSLLGVKPLIGRWFTPEECKFNGPSAAILSHAFWTRRFGADPAIVGRSLRLNDRSVTITGVLPASFDFATVFEPGTRVDMFSPYPMSEETNRTGNSLAIVGRLKPGVSVEAARAKAT